MQEPGGDRARLFLNGINDNGITVFVDLMDVFGQDNKSHGEQIQFCLKNFIGPAGRSRMELNEVEHQQVKAILTQAGFFDPYAAEAADHYLTLGGSYGTMLDGLTALGSKNADCFFGERLRDDDKDGTVAQILERTGHTDWAKRCAWYQEQLREDDPFRNEHLLGILAAQERGGGYYSVESLEISGIQASVLHNEADHHNLIVYNVPNAAGKNHATTTSCLTWWWQLAERRKGQTIGLAAGAIEGIRHYFRAEGVLHEFDSTIDVQLLMRSTPLDQRDYYTLNGLHEVGKLVQMAFGIKR